MPVGLEPVAPASTTRARSVLASATPDAPGWIDESEELLPRPRIEILDERGQLRIAAELPGLQLEAVSVRIQEGLLTLRGRLRPEAAWRWRDRRYDLFESRSVLPVGGPAWDTALGDEPGSQEPARGGPS